MNKKNEQLKETAIEAMKVYREAITEELVKSKKKLVKQLMSCTKTDIEMDLMEQLEEMNADDIIQKFLEFSQILCLCENICFECTDKINDIRELIDKINDIDMAINVLF